MPSDGSGPGPWPGEAPAEVLNGTRRKVRQVGGDENDGVALLGVEWVGIDESPINDHQGVGPALKGQSPQQAAEQQAPCGSERTCQVS